VNEEHGFPWIFPYIEEPRHPGSLFRERPPLRPVVPVTFIGPDGPQQVFALVDSGADHIVAAPWIAQAVGIDLHRAPEEALKVAGRSNNVKFVTGRLELSHPRGTAGAPVQWEAQIGFFEKWPSPSWGAVLGQTGFFDRFTITMSRQATMLAVQDWDGAVPDRPAEALVAKGRPPQSDEHQGLGVGRNGLELASQELDQERGDPDPAPLVGLRRPVVEMAIDVGDR
jgi:hypothetical protein